MGFPVPTNSPQITVSGTKYAIAAFDWPNIVGDGYMIGVFQQQLDGSWNSAGRALATYMNPGDALADIQAKGGTVKYLQWMIAQFNTIIATLFAAPPPVSSEPKTETEARAWLTATVPTLKLTLVNGVPVLG